MIRFDVDGHVAVISFSRGEAFARRRGRRARAAAAGAPGQAVETAKALAARITANAPMAVRMSRQLILDAPGQTDRDGMKAAGQAMVALGATEDYAEGPRAFIEKRDPVWKGR